MNYLENMRCFVSVVEAGSISAAAERLNVAKSMVSRRLKELEQHLGVQLMTRTTRSQSLTETGQAYLERCRRILADVDELDSSVASQQASLSGQLKIAAPLTFGVHHLTPAINEFIAQHPEIEFDINFNDRRVDLVQDGFDLAIRIGELNDSTMVARRIAPIRRAVCANRDYLERYGEPTHPNDLRQHRVLHYSNLPHASWRYRMPNGSQGSVNVPTKILANNGDFIRCAAIAGHGIVLLPTFVIHDALRDGSLIPILTHYEWPELTMYAIYPQTRHLSIRVRSFIDFLIDRFCEVPCWDRDLPTFA